MGSEGWEIGHRETGSSLSARIPRVMMVGTVASLISPVFLCWNNGPGILGARKRRLRDD